MSGGPAVPEGFSEEPTGWTPRGKPGPEGDGSCLRAQWVGARDGARLGAPTQPVSRRQGLVRGLCRPRGHRCSASFRTGEEGQGPKPALRGGPGTSWGTLGSPHAGPPCPAGRPRASHWSTQELSPEVPAGHHPCRLPSGDLPSDEAPSFRCWW